MFQPPQYLHSREDIVKGILSQIPENAENMHAHYDAYIIYFVDEVTLICHYLDSTVGTSSILEFHFSAV